MKANKIAFVYHNLILSDGSSTVIWNLARRLARDHDVTIFTFFDAICQNNSGVQVKEISIPFKSNRFINPALSPLFQNKWHEMRKGLRQFDVIITYPFPASMIPLFPTKLKPLNILVEWKVGMIPKPSLSEKIFYYFDEKMGRYALRHVDRVIAPSKLVEKYVLTTGVTPTRMLIDGIDFDLFDNRSISTKEVYERYPLLRGGRIILFVGRLYQRKNIDTLVRSLKIVQRVVPNAKLLVVGGYDRNPGYYKSLVNLVEELGLRDSVIFTGAAPWSDLLKYYAACETFASPSLYEGFLRAEAFAMGKPMVAFDITSNSETIKDGENGFLVREITPEAFASALINILNDDGLRVEMGKNGYRWARENLDFDTIAKNLVKFIES